MPKSFTYKYPRPMVTVDLVVFALSEEGLRALFIRRKKDPFAGRWAIPGGYLEMDESIEAGARRELKEETGLHDLLVVEQIGVFGEPGRDPRGRTISIGHAGIVKGPPPQVQGGDDAASAAWLDPATLDPLAFDHDAILERARSWLSICLCDDQFMFSLLPEVFAARDVQKVHRAILGPGATSTWWITESLEGGVIERVSGKLRRYRAVPAVNNSRTNRPR